MIETQVEIQKRMTEKYKKRWQRLLKKERNDKII